MRVQDLLFLLLSGSDHTDPGEPGIFLISGHGKVLEKQKAISGPEKNLKAAILSSTFVILIQVIQSILLKEE